MNEYQIAAKIRQLLDADERNIPEVPIHTFVFMWFHNKPFKELEFVDRMMRFADTYNFGYITILDHRRHGVAVSFWNKEEIKLLTEKGE